MATEWRWCPKECGERAHRGELGGFRCAICIFSANCAWYIGKNPLCRTRKGLPESGGAGGKERAWTYRFQRESSAYAQWMSSEPFPEPWLPLPPERWSRYREPRPGCNLEELPNRFLGQANFSAYPAASAQRWVNTSSPIPRCRWNRLPLNPLPCAG